MKVLRSVLRPMTRAVCSAILVGLLAGLVFPYVIKLFSQDQLLSLVEFVLSVAVTGLIINLFAIAISRPSSKFSGIPGTLTLFIPILGPLAGGTGKEPFWIFVILGIVGCLFWSIPLFLGIFISAVNKKIGSDNE